MQCCVHLAYENALYGRMTPPQFEDPATPRTPCNPHPNVRLVPPMRGGGGAISK